MKRRVSMIVTDDSVEIVDDEPMDMVMGHPQREEKPVLRNALFQDVDVIDITYVKSISARKVFRGA